MSFVDLYQFVSSLHKLSDLLFLQILILSALSMPVLCICAGRTGFYISFAIIVFAIPFATHFKNDMKKDGIEVLERRIAKMDNYRVYLLNTSLLNYYKTDFSHYEYNKKLSEIQKRDGVNRFNTEDVYDFILLSGLDTFKMLDKNVKDMEKVEKAETDKAEIQLLKEEVERLSKELEDERADNCLTICKTQ